jgi:hypothetical protein
MKTFIISLFLFITVLISESSGTSVPGYIINHSPASTGVYIGCPGIAIIGDGVYLAKHSEFGPGSSEWESAITHVYRSEDSGNTWDRISTIDGLFWASIFTHNNAVYLFGTDKHHGNTVIMKSEDGGKTWTVPADSNSGLLLEGQYHTAPVPILIHNGRIWRAMEDASGTMAERGGPWGGPQYSSFMMSAPVDSDLLQRDSWTISNVVERQQEWLDGQTRAWLEGNAVPTPQGDVSVILRVNFLQDSIEPGGIAAIIDVSGDGKQAVFNPEIGFIDFPGGAKKFTIRYDPESNQYWTLTNYVPSHHQGQGNAGRIRNTLALASSHDLRHWHIRSVILYHPDIINHAFQYVDWLFEGDDIIAASRTAYDDGLGGARNAHDANYLTFHRVENFRMLQEDDFSQSFIELSRGHNSWHIVKPEYKDPEDHLVARWCFESGQSPLDDTAPAGQVSDNLRIHGSVVIEDGIAKFSAGKEGVGIKVNPSVDLSHETEMTLWVRLKVDSQPTDTIWFLDKGTTSTQNRSYGLYLAPDSDVDYQFAYGGKLSQDGIKWVKNFSGESNENPPVGLWVQLAMVVRADGPLLMGEWYFRTEHTSRPNPWRLLDRSSSMRAIFDGDSPLIIGNNANMGELSADFLIDEVKLYDRALSLEELNNCWAILGPYPKIPSEVPGTVIDHIPAATGIYLGSPSLVIMPDGTYVAKADEFGRGAEGFVTRVYHSLDRGNSWKQIATIEGDFWSNIFYHNGALYLMGTSAGHRRGHCVIRKSGDGGYTWTVPKDENSGLLFDDISYHTAPMQMVIHSGRIWRSMEDEQGEPQNWGTQFRAFMMSAPIDADLLKASSWISSDRLGYNPNWLDGRFRGWLEGNVVVNPQGEIVNVLRVDYRPDGGKAAIIRYSGDGRQSYFDPEKDFIDFPGGNKKFFIRFDDESGYYWALSNAILPRHAGGNLDRAREYVRQRIPTSSDPGGEYTYSNPERTRNTLALMVSRDLREWEIRDIVLYHPEISKHGFQYPHFVFDGDDIIFLSRTSYDDGQGGADNQHNANFITFHRTIDFRKLLTN